MALLLTVETMAEPPTLVFRPERRQLLADTTDPFMAYARCAERFSHAEAVQQMLLTDLCVQLPSQFLTQVDRATMAHSLEARVPFLDERVAALAVGMESSWKVQGLQKKVVLRNAMRGRLPSDILDGPKSGFGVPFEQWLKTSLYEFARQRILAPRFIQRFELDASVLRDTLDAHRSGRQDRGFLLWKLLQLALWAER
jgi:asparagine synthase (glutamine-hydrolysing)